MPTLPLALKPSSVEIRKAGAVVGLTDRIYSPKGDEVVFDDVLVQGDLSGRLAYNGHTIEVVAVDTAIGLEMSSGGARGPVWKGVKCKLVH